MRIAFDFDDVLVDFVGAFLRGLNISLARAHGKIGGYTRFDIELDGWDMGPWANRTLVNNGLMTPGERWLDWFMNTHMPLWMYAKTESGAVRVMEALVRDGHRLEIVTNKPLKARKVVYTWLLEWNAPVESVHILDGHFDKHEVSEADVLVDDRPDTLRAWIDSRPRRMGILYARSQNEDDRRGLYVAESMDDVYALVTAYQRVGLERRVVPVVKS